MIVFGPYSITLLIAAAQGLVLAVLLWRAPHNRAANRWLALLILAFVSLITPYIIGFAGFYDRWRWLSFAPFSYALAFGPLLYLYVTSLIGRPPQRVWPHFLPVLVEFLANALVFPWPLATKNWWDSTANAPIIQPILSVATVISMLVYGAAALAAVRRYALDLDKCRTDGVDFNPGWIRNFLLALAAVALVWAGSMLADWLDPSRNYFDRFWLYVLFSALVLYLGIEGWRHADRTYPRPEPPALPEAEADTGRDWPAQAALWADRIAADSLWRQPDLTLASLARQLGTNTAYLSRALNEGLGENFNSVINRYRVTWVMAALQDPAEQRDLLTLAFDAGFASKASFNRAFAAIAGMSPSAFRLKS